ncbi:hypothetical protein [Paenibacillus sp. 32O-W]|uniref:hypothetical protein n=1 Tax=Paenibacillus sp. 32O-W TaxID=1695218 RepID=UPI00139670F0|nr:hypothetical protein [Paenibacillus sp. 32O-W]
MLSQEEYHPHDSMLKQVEAIRASGKKQGVVYLENDNRKTDILVYKKLPQTGWMLVGFVSEQDLYAQLFKLRKTILLLASLLLVLSLLLATWLSHGITKPAVAACSVDAARSTGRFRACFKPPASGQPDTQ